VIGQAAKKVTGREIVKFVAIDETGASTTNTNERFTRYVLHGLMTIKFIGH